LKYFLSKHDAGMRKSVMPEERLVMILTTGRCYEEDAVLFGYNAVLSWK
jgi:hypothetical protein